MNEKGFAASLTVTGAGGAQVERSALPSKSVPARILLVEHDDGAADEIVLELQGRGFCADHAADCHTGLQQGVGGDYDVIILDRGLGVKSSLALASELKALGVDAPILMINAPAGGDEQIPNLAAAADDYLPKPLVLADLTARVEAIMRRRRGHVDALALRYADLELDLVSRTVRRGGREIRLFPKEVKLLEMFMRHPEQVLTRARIFETIWGYTFDPGTNLIDVHVRAIRRKLEVPGAPSLLQTARGAGYVLRLSD